MGIDPTNENIRYWEYQNGVLHRSTFDGDGKSTIKNISPPDKAWNGGWVTPYKIDQTNPNRIIAGYDVIYKSLNKGDSWTVISPSLAGGQNISHVAISKSNPNRVYASYGNNFFAKSTVNNTWQTYTAPISIRDIEVDPTNANTVYISGGGYTAGQKVFKSVDAGATWTNISGTLDNILVTCIEPYEDVPGGLFIGTNFGVYYKDNSTNDWAEFGTLPHTEVRDIEIQYSNQKIRAGTYGRGIFEAEIVTIDAGTINGGGTFCNSLVGNHTLKNTTAASGGCDGNIQYQWQYRLKSSCATNWGGWTNWGGRTSATVTWAASGDRDHQFRRAAKRTTCGAWGYSNTITFDVDKQLSNAGTINGGRTFCNSSVGSRTLGNATAASGGCGGNIQYQWQYRLKGACVGSWLNWTNYNGRTSATATWGGHADRDYQFRRAAKRTTCGAWRYSNTLTIDVDKPLTNAGTISGGGSFCSSTGAVAMGNSSNPSGGCGGPIEYSWQFRNRNACSSTWGSWRTLGGGTRATSSWTGGTADHQFRRGARRSGCGNYIYSNVVTFDIDKPLTTGGTIGGGGVFCNSTGAQRITNTANPIGGCSGNGNTEKKELVPRTGVLGQLGAVKQVRERLGPAAVAHMTTNLEDC